MGGMLGGLSGSWEDHGEIIKIMALELEKINYGCL